MPLPVGGNWPPPAVAATADRLAVWAAWHSGEPDELARVYGGGLNPTGGPAAAFFHDSQYRGGVVGKFARFFWGTPPSPGEQRTKVHVPIAGDLAALSADLLFSDPPTLGAESAATGDRLESYEECGLWTSLREAAEVGAAMGGVYLRVVWDRAVSDKPWLSAVGPDGAIPEWSWDRLAAVTFWKVLDSDGTGVLRHLERHEPGRILHGLYEGTRDKLGRSIPLTEHPATAGIAKALTSGDGIETGTQLLTAEYIPNMRPNRLWRNVPCAVNYGRSDYAGIEPLMDSLDEAWGSWMRDLRLGKARIIVPTEALESLGRGQGAIFDADKEVFTGMDLGPNPDTTITETQFKIRVEEHEGTTKALVEQIVRSAGYSIASLGGTGDIAMTATEVTARERRSLTTRGQKAGYWSTGLARILTALLAVDQARFKTPITVETPDVDFPEAVSADPKDVAQTAQLLAQAVAASTETLVRMVHPDWDDTRVTAEVAAIREANKPPTPVVVAPPADPMAGKSQPGQMEIRQ